LGTIAVVSFFIVQQTLKIANGDGNNSIAFLFGSTQLLVTAAGAFFPDPKYTTKLVGQTFIFPIIVSLLEYSECAPFLSKVGGHAWYDITLHISVLCSLLDSGDKGIIEYVKSIL
jgi:hypothetical protein